MNTSVNWSSNEGHSSSCDTASVALSEMVAAEHQVLRGHATSPEHLVNRKALLERMGMEGAAKIIQRSVSVK